MTGTKKIKFREKWYSPPLSGELAGKVSIVLYVYIRALSIIYLSIIYLSNYLSSIYLSSI